MGCFGQHKTNIKKVLSPHTRTARKHPVHHRILSAQICDTGFIDRKQQDKKEYCKVFHPISFSMGIVDTNRFYSIGALELIPSQRLITITGFD